MVLALPLLTRAATVDFDSPAQVDDLTDIRSVTVIDDVAYVMNYERLNDTPLKELYQLQTPERPAVLLHSATGTLGDDDAVVGFDGDLYHTITRKRGEAVQVFRSTDDGDTWEEVGAIGYTNVDIKNQVLGTYTSSGRLYIIVAQKHRYDGEKKRLGVWSTTDGDTWKKSTISWNRHQTLVAARIWNDRPFVLVSGKAKDKNAQIRLYTTLSTNGSTLVQTAENNLSSEDPITTSNGMTITDDALYVTGTNLDEDVVSLRSTDGIAWEATEHAMEQIVTIDGTLFGVSGSTYYTSGDGESWDTVTLSFEDDLGMNLDEIQSTFGKTQDDSGMTVRVWSEDDKSDVQCWFTTDAVSWSQLAGCAPAKQVPYRSVVSFDDYWYGIKGVNSHSLYRFSL